MKYFFVSVLMVFMTVFSADAAVKIKNDTAAKFEAQQEMEMSEADAIAALENDIAILDNEIAKCQKQKKAWVAATVIGSAGTLATGVAAAAQGVQIKEQKEVLSDKTTELRQLEAEKRGLEVQLAQ